MTTIEADVKMSTWGGGGWQRDFAHGSWQRRFCYNSYDNINDNNRGYTNHHRLYRVRPINVLVWS